ncbi:phosphatidylglycerol lysyltransferase domain-containing protein [Aureimonas sp. AU22]|uniref:phosphatidylglycerol lysyltransferase domain-containing protein n=1 Tax=Aureimonas sp. AU22 TaxID=1638162 RepID=UPI000784357D|nr:phosphatidylglycerol lysyltransferase domain-containing protein [Aureimonas sp. AU22]
MPNFKSMMDAWLEARLPTVSAFEPDLATRLSLCVNHGDFSLAYSTAVQPGLGYFGDVDGYVAFATKMGHAFVLGDPVAHEGDRADYIRRVVTAMPRPCFVQVGHATAGVLADLGYRVNQMGIESNLDLATHSFAGKRNETIRYSEAWLRKKGYRILECDGSIADSEQVRHISTNWRKGRIVSRREMRFLNRPFEPRLGPHMRRFMIAHPDGHVIAILDFDPIFKNGAVIGYTAAFKRKLVGTTAHAEIGLTKFAADRFKEEGRTRLSFGLSPLADIEASTFPESRLWRRSFQQAFRSRRVNENVFNLQGQAAFKRRFHGARQVSYIAFKRGSPIEMLALLRLLKTL